MEDLRADLLEALADRLTGDRWRARPPDDEPDWADLLTLELPANEQGVGLSVVVSRSRDRHDQPWHTLARRTYTVEGAQGLAALVDEPDLAEFEVDDDERGGVLVRQPDDAAEAAGEVAAWLDGWSTDHDLVTPEAVLALVRAEAGDDEGDEADGATRSGVRLVDRWEAEEARKRGVLYLLAAGDRAEAGQLLAGIDTTYGTDRRFVHRLGPWMDGGRPLPDPPAQPAQRPTLLEMDPPLSLADSRKRSKLRQEAIDEVRSEAGGRSWEEARDLLARAVDERDAGWDSFLLLEVAVQRLRRPRPSGLKRLRHAAKGLRELGGNVWTLTGSLEKSEVRVPEELRPPLRACFYVGLGRGDAPVLFDDDAEDQLAKAIADAPPTVDGRFAELEGWLTWQDEEQGDLAVHLGNRVIGLLVGEAAALYHPCLEAAAARGELPCVDVAIGLLDDGRRWVVTARLPVGTAEKRAVPEPLTRPTAADVGAVVRSMFPSRRPREEADG